MEAALNRDNDSSSFYHSIHHYSFAIMAQLMCMDARLNTLSDELCQVNTHVSRIARQQVVMNGFIAYTSPSPLASKDASDDGSGSDDANEDEDVSLLSDDEMST